MGDGLGVVEGGGVGLIRVGHVLGEELLHFWGQEL